MQIPDKFKSPYNPSETEGRVYKLWEENGFFNPDVCIEKGVTKPDTETFSMVLPPPNVTGRLHVGHVLEQSLQDATVRFERMRGKKTLWIPGTDHAAIATQARVEKQLSKEKKSRHDFSREEFFNLVQDFALRNQKEILEQLKKLGGSLDWSRLAFTLDEEREVAVRTAFKNMYEDGLIYQGDKVVNWDPKGQTTVSDDEVVHEESTGVLYTFKYSPDFPISIATTRPETKLGDTAVAVHPDDERYSKYVGKTYSMEFAGVPLEIKIVADEAVDPEYGTGAVGVTPAHSYTDWEIAERHNLPLKQVINEYAKMENTTDEIDGMKTKDAREYVVKWLNENNLLENKEDTEMNIARAERTNGIIEPLPKLQWFVDVNKKIEVRKSKISEIKEGESYTLKELMRIAVESGAVTITPGRFEKVYFNWIDNLHDWNISRQILYGHRIPVWYKEDEIYVGVEAPEKNNSGDGWEQDPDTLDTWFSSALWPFSALGWPEETDDLKTYFPHTLMNPGYEILFFWVARMILMSTYLEGDVPFKTVLIHGMVRDKQGRKFSKSLDNGIEPEEVIEQYGTDALRMAMLVGNTPGNDINFDMNDVRGYSKFANKIWNASRFVLENLPDTYDHGEKPDLDKKGEDYVNELAQYSKEITSDIESYRFHLASEKAYHYFWHTFADVIIEEYKDDLKSGEGEARERAAWILTEILKTSLIFLHPFMPFITEEIWQHMPIGNKQLLMVTEWASSYNKT